MTSPPKEGHELWQAVTVQILGMMRRIVKVSSAQKSTEYPFVICFH